MEQRRDRQKPRMTLVQKPFMKKGVRVWSFSDLENLVEWTSTQVVSRCGVHLLVRTRGVPMGSGISPVKAVIAMAECERRAWLNVSRAREQRHVRVGERVCEVYNGKRLADDITLFSKVNCAECIFSFAKGVYLAPLEVEREEDGQQIRVCDLELQILGSAAEVEVLEIRKFDKNAAYVVGECDSPPRVRYQPYLGKPIPATITAWFAGRWHDEILKNKLSAYHAGLASAGAVDAVAEVLLFGHPFGVVMRGVKGIRDPALVWLRNSAMMWLRRYVCFESGCAQIQRAAWSFHVDIGAP